MIEQRRPPFRAVMAALAAGNSVNAGELASVNILVARLALARSGTEIHVLQRPLQVRGTMAVCARHGTMSAQQAEGGAVVVKSPQFLPLLGRVARLAAGSLAIRAYLGHARAEFAVMRIAVASGAGQLRKMKDCAASARRGLVAVNASNGNVTAGQRKSLIVLGQGEGGRIESFFRMALFAAVPMGRGGKLLHVRIFMAVEALVEFQPVNRRASRGNMAGGASKQGVLIPERISGRVVLG